MQANQQTSINEANEIRALNSTALAGDEVPNRVLLAPWGQVESSNGSFNVDEESARLTVQAFEEHGTDLPIDYEHQTLGGTYSSPSGQAPAAGWIKRLFAETGVGLLAEIEWTEQARKMLAAKEYRYLSPVAIVRKNDRKLVAIHSAALTNKPAIVGMTPLVNRDTIGSSEADDEPLLLWRSALGLSADADAREVLAAAGRRLAEMKSAATRRHTAERIREAMRAGKLVEAQRTWAEELVAREEDLFDQWLKTAPVVVRIGASTPPQGTDGTRHRTSAVTARAKSEFHAHPILANLTTEEAYVADALRMEC